MKMRVAILTVIGITATVNAIDPNTLKHLEKAGEYEKDKF